MEARHKKDRGPLYVVMHQIIDDLKDNSNSWPFIAPVTGVDGYYDVITNPMGKKSVISEFITTKHFFSLLTPFFFFFWPFLLENALDLQTLESNIDSDVYPNLNVFVDDVNKIFVNCRLFNEDGSRYVKLADNLEKDFLRKLEERRSSLQDSLTV